MLNILTIVLDGMPWIPCQFIELLRCHIPWRWVIVEGAAMNVKDTAWMDAQPPRLSSDGTSEFLDSIAYHPCVTVIRRERWEGKTEMCNAGVAEMTESGILLQADSDELWTAWQLESLYTHFVYDSELRGVKVAMDYRIGPHISTTGTGYGNRDSEWVRAWRYFPGMKFDCHEPPVFAGNRGKWMEKDESEILFGRILHMAWATRKQCEMKEKLYGKNYKDAAVKWEALQRNQDWPISDLSKRMPWMDNAGADIAVQTNVTA